MKSDSKGFAGRFLVIAVCIIVALGANAASAQNTGAPLTGKFSGLVYNRATQTFNSVLTLTNIGALPVQSPILIVISTGTAAVSVVGSPNGSTYAVNLPSGSLAPGASAKVVVAFSDPTRVAFTPRITGILGTLTVAQATIASATGGTITVTTPGSPLNGAQVVIPPGALGDSADTITVGYSNALPAPINPTATAAGLIPVSGALILTRTGSTPLHRAIQVSMPYSLATLGPKDFPFVGHWDNKLGRYEPVQVISTDQTAGTVTFVTKHFSVFVPVGIPGLASMLEGTMPFIAQLQSLDSQFRPAHDGFEASNFTTQKLSFTPKEENGGGGVCFGLTSFAAWYFAAHPASKPLFPYSHTPKSDPGDSPIPQEDSLARELIAQNYNDTIDDNFIPLPLASGPLHDLDSASKFIEGLLWSGEPQLATIVQSPKPPYGAAHSVLVYNWNAAAQTFGIYDPNLPSPETQPPPFHWQWTISNIGFDPWTTPSIRGAFNYISFDAYGSHYDKSVLASLLARMQSGQGPKADGGWWFNDLSIASPTAATAGAYPGSQSGPTYKVDPANGTQIVFSWRCPDCDGTLLGNGEWLHVYQDNVPLNTVPIINGAASVRTRPFASPTSELIAFVSQVSTTGTGAFTDQSDTWSGYDGFMRIELQPGWPFSVTWTETLSGSRTVTQPMACCWIDETTWTRAQSFTGVVGIDINSNIVNVSVEGDELWTDFDSCGNLGGGPDVYYCLPWMDTNSVAIVDAGPLQSWASLAQVMQVGHDAQGPFITNPFYFPPDAQGNCGVGISLGQMTIDVDTVITWLGTSTHNPSTYTTDSFALCLDGGSQYLRPDDATGNSFSARSTVNYPPQQALGPLVNIAPTVTWEVHVVRGTSTSR